ESPARLNLTKNRQQLWRGDFGNGALPNYRIGKSSNQRFLTRVTSARPSRSNFFNTSSATARKVLPFGAVSFSSRRWVEGSILSASSRLAASRFSRACFNVTVG